MSKYLGMFGIIFLFIIFGCNKQAQEQNQTSPLLSPDGKYILTVPIERNPKDRNLPFWRVTISDKKGNVLYKDRNSQFIATLNVYWCWDGDDRVWLYNSDDGMVYFWELDNNGNWIKQKWGYGNTKEINRQIYPPDILYPEYEKLKKE